MYRNVFANLAVIFALLVVRPAAAQHTGESVVVVNDEVPVKTAVGTSTAYSGNILVVRGIEGNHLEVEFFYKHGLIEKQHVVPLREAVGYWTAIIRSEPGRAAKLLVCRGLAKSALGDHEGAIADLTEAIRLGPHPICADAHMVRGRIWRKTKTHSNAIMDFSEAIRLRPDNPNGYGERARTWVEMTQYQQALRDWDSAIQISPE
jgi:tetratricopeptide (TPR) repeat protein